MVKNVSSYAVTVIFNFVSVLQETKILTQTFLKTVFLLQPRSDFYQSGEVVFHINQIFAYQ